MTNPWDDANADDDLFEELSAVNQNKGSNTSSSSKPYEVISGPGFGNISDTSLTVLEPCGSSLLTL